MNLKVQDKPTSKFTGIPAGDSEHGKQLGVAAVISAFNPSEELIALVGRLHQVGFGPLIVVDDGSDDAFAGVFDALSSMPQVDVLRHAATLGKGRAVQTAINHFLMNYSSSAGVVTVSASGEHQPEDALAVAETLLRNPKKLVLGYRISCDGFPWTARLANFFRRSLFRIMVGKRITDTQTGLRGIPRSVIPQMLALDGARYEFEIGMLINSSKFTDDIVEQPIRTS